MPKKTDEKKTLASQIKAARRVSVPLLGITTPDPSATIEVVAAAATRKQRDDIADIPKMVWDIVQGLRAMNEPAKSAVASVIGDGDSTIGNPTQLLILAQKLPPDSLLFVHMANRWLADNSFIQAAWNLRDKFKTDHRMLVMLGPKLDLPPELTGDVIVLDEPLPDPDQLEAIVTCTGNQAEMKIEGDELARSVEAIQGLSAFQAEQVVAMSLTKDGIDLPDLWERKRRQIELTPGLKVMREDVTFDDIGGVAVVKDFLKRIAHGNSRPNAVVLIEEIEKMMAGSGGDSSGVSQDQLGTILTYMQDHNAVGCIFVGPPGSAKSAVAKATGNESGIPAIQLDLGGVKSQFVGASEGNLRSALKVITSVSNDKSIWICTSNNIANLPPELRRRFGLGTYFFDIPDRNERKAIWKIWLVKYAQKVKSTELPDDEGWTGAEIRQCCDIAYRLNVTLKEAALYVVPVSRSASDQLERLQKGAEGRFLSASKPGVYRRDSAEQPKSGRKLSLEE